MDFLFSYLALAGIYVLLGLSTNLLVGIAGIFSVSQAAVFGVGAYIVAHFLMAADPMPRTSTSTRAASSWTPRGPTTRSTPGRTRGSSARTDDRSRW